MAQDDVNPLLSAQPSARSESIRQASAGAPATNPLPRSWPLENVNETASRTGNRVPVRLFSTRYEDSTRPLSGSGRVQGDAAGFRDRFSRGPAGVGLHQGYQPLPRLAGRADRRNPYRRQPFRGHAPRVAGDGQGDVDESRRPAPGLRR